MLRSNHRHGYSIVDGYYTCSVLLVAKGDGIQDGRIQVNVFLCLVYLILV